MLAQYPRYREAEVATLRLDRVIDDTLELIPVNANDQRLDDIVRVPREELAAIPLAQIRLAFPRMASARMSACSAWATCADQRAGASRAQAR